MLTLAQKTLVQETFARVATIADDAAALFYRRLFEIDPSLQPMFHGNMAEQRKKLTQMLTVAVKGLDHLDQLVPAVQGLGRRHAIYGVTDKHYETVGAALLWTLQKALGTAFTREAREAWATVYGFLATTMKDAAREGLAARNRIVASAVNWKDVVVVNPWIASRFLRLQPEAADRAIGPGRNETAIGRERQ